MNAPRRTSVLTVLAVAILGGAFAGAVGAAFIWVVEEGVHAVWVELPEALDVDPFGSWWQFAVPIVGGLLIGLGQLLVGDVPMPMAVVLQRFRSGVGVDPRLVPGSFVLASLALVAGGALGFEAALACIIGGFATGIGRQLGSRGRDVRSAWGLGDGTDLPPAIRSGAGWLAAISGLFTYLWLPFGEIDLGFRLDRFDGVPDSTDGLIVVVFGLVAVVPTAWALSLVVRAEHAPLVRRSPIVIAVAGGVVLALLGSVNELVFFSGQNGVAVLGDLSNGDLAYVAVAKWVALCVVMLAGWRGGPIFPLYLSLAAAAVLVCDPLGVPFELAAVAGMTVVSVVFLRGKIVLAVVFTLYAVPISYAGTMLVVAAGAATGLLVAGELGWLPAHARPVGDGESTAA